ncbi:MAG: hypothetical protein J6R40_00150 [Clostridia bacterium]|nr:hypothetical protein [Clostridia bacterium]
MDIEHAERLATVEGLAENNARRLDDVEKRQDNLDALVGTVKELAVREKQVETDVKEIKNDVKTLASKPGQRWDSLVDKIVWAVAAAVVGFLLAKIGL